MISSYRTDMPKYKRRPPASGQGAQHMLARLWSKSDASTRRFRVSSFESVLNFGFRSSNSPNRRGLAIIEVVAALSLVGAGLLMTAQILVACAQHRLASDQLLAAQLEVANAQERIAAMRYSDLTPDNLERICASERLTAGLPDAQLHVSLKDAPGQNSASKSGQKQIRAEVTWPAEDGEPHRVGLTSWKFPDEAQR